MSREELKCYLNAQVEEIRQFMQAESARRGCTVDFKQAAMEWIDRFSDTFRAKWFENHPINPRLDSVPFSPHASQQ